MKHTLQIRESATDRVVFECPLGDLGRTSRAWGWLKANATGRMSEYIVAHARGGVAWDTWTVDEYFTDDERN